MPKYLQWLSLSSVDFDYFVCLRILFCAFQNLQNGPLTFRVSAGNRCQDPRGVQSVQRSHCLQRFRVKVSAVANNSRNPSLYLAQAVSLESFLGSGRCSFAFSLGSGGTVSLKCCQSLRTKEIKLCWFFTVHPCVRKSHIACSMRKPDSTVLIHTNRRNSSVWQAGLITTKEPIR